VNWFITYYQPAEAAAAASSEDAVMELPRASAIPWRLMFNYLLSVPVSHKNVTTPSLST